MRTMRLLSVWLVLVCATIGAVEAFALSADDVKKVSLIIFGDESYAAESYRGLADKVAKTWFGLKMVQLPQLRVVIIPYDAETADSNGNMPLLLGTAVEAMAKTEAQLQTIGWVAIAHGKGGAVATTLVAAVQSRIKVLAMLGSLPNPAINLQTLDLNLYTVLISGADDAVVTPQQVVESAVLFPAEAKIVQLAGVSHSDFVNGYSAGEGAPLTAVDAVITEIYSGMSFMNYPGIMEEGKPFLASGPRPTALHCKLQVEVEVGKAVEVVKGCSELDNSDTPVNVTVTATSDGGYIFAPSTGPIRAGVAFFQGAACPTGAYGSLLSALAQRGFLSVAISATVRNAMLALDKAHDIVTSYQAGRLPAIIGHNDDGDVTDDEAVTAVSDWFISGHSLGGNAASSFAFAHPETVVGVMLFAGGSQGLNFTAAKITLPFFQAYGSRDAYVNAGPDGGADRYVLSYLEPWVPKDQLTTLKIPGGTHYTWGYYGYQRPYETAALWREDQIIMGANAAAEWANGILQLKAQSGQLKLEEVNEQGVGSSTSFEPALRRQTPA